MSRKQWGAAFGSDGAFFGYPRLGCSRRCSAGIVSRQQCVAAVGGAAADQQAGFDGSTWDTPLSVFFGQGDASALQSKKPQTSDPVQTHLLKLVDDDSSFDEMVQALQSNPERVAAELLKLELEGLVVAQPGLRWRSL